MTANSGPEQDTMVPSAGSRTSSTASHASNQRGTPKGGINANEDSYLRTIVGEGDELKRVPFCAEEELEANFRCK